MKFTPNLERGIIEKRYKRFLADIFIDKKLVTVHVPNTGAMTTCWEKGWPVLLRKSDNAKRKYPYTLELTHNGETWISVNTSLTNKLVLEGIKEGSIPELEGYTNIHPEKKYKDSRIDFFLKNHKKEKDAFVEVKNVTLREKNYALFPDAVSTRGQKHLECLMELKKEGFRSVMLFIVNREDVKIFSPAKEIDPVYANLLKEAYKEGVEILAYQTRITPAEISIHKKIKVEL